MFLEERLEAIERKQEEIIAQNAEILSQLRKPIDEYLSAKEFSEKAGIGYIAARSLINKGILPSPVHFKINGRDKINWRLYCEWLAVPGNARKLEKL